MNLSSKVVCGVPYKLGMFEVILFAVVVVFAFVAVVAVPALSVVPFAFLSVFENAVRLERFAPSLLVVLFPGPTVQVAALREA